MRDIGNLKLSSSVAMVLAAAGLVGLSVVSMGLAGGSGPEASSSSVYASWAGKGSHAQALEIRYRTAAPDDQVSGVISVYVQPLGKSGETATAEPILVDRILPFAPPDEEGVRTTFLQIPAALSDTVGSDWNRVLVSLKVEPARDQSEGAERSLSLLQATAH